MLQPKSPAPAFSMPSTSGRTVSTRDLRGQRYVLYFYPRDDTPGCTQEACDFRDNLARLQSAGVQVFGVSRDTLTSHGKFKQKYELPFELLSDPDNAVAKAYGAYGEKMMYGKPVQGTIRSTFLIGADGKVERIWSPVKVIGHVDAVLSAIAGEPSAPFAAEPAAAAGPAKKPAKKPAQKPASKGLLTPPRAPGAKKPARVEAAGRAPAADKKPTSTKSTPTTKKKKTK
jgi:peroxiredoxin Q/BCP